MTLELINNPSQEQEQQFEAYKEKWKKYGLSTEPMEKERAREAVMLCYDNAESGGLPRPKFVLFVESPFQLYYTKPIWNRICDLLVFTNYGKDLPRCEYDPVLWYTMETDNPLRLRAIDRIFSEIMREVSPDVDFNGNTKRYVNFFGWVQHKWLKENPIPELVKEAEKELGAEIYGQHETWLCYYEWQEDIGAKGCEATYGLQEMARSAGWWIPYDELAVISDRPREIHVDEDGRLHSHTRPAIRFTDGWEYCASHGVKIPNWIINNPELLSVTEINREHNLEIRRVMLEIYTLERYLEESNAQLLDRNDDPHVGSLYRISQNDDEDMVLLKVANSTMEADGTYKTYVIRVPPDMITARQARAWTFGFEAEEFEPIHET